MDSQNNIQDELRSMNSGLPVENSQNPFSVPDGYFDGLASSVLAKVKAQDASAAAELEALSPLLAGLSKALPYSVPAGYFEDNVNSLASVWKEEESPLLATIGKGLPYTVPQDYFKTLPAQIVAKLVPKAKVVPLFARTWMRAAVAAVIGGVVFLGGHHYLNSDKDDRSAYVQPADTSSNWVAKNESKTVQELKTASTKDLDEFIKTVPVTSDKKNLKTASQPTEVTKLLKGVSEKEIDAFLEQLPTPDEDLALID